MFSKVDVCLHLFWLRTVFHVVVLSLTEQNFANKTASVVSLIFLIVLPLLLANTFFRKQ